jgi:hypothetical protein
MPRCLYVAVRVMLVGSFLITITEASVAAGDFMNMPTSTNAAAAPLAEEQHEQSWYREQSAKPDPKAIVQQKAQIRGQQRMDRIASMNWYGMSNSRPQGSPTPFFTRYGPTWEMPGGKPYSWYPQSRPGYVMYWR